MKNDSLKDNEFSKLGDCSLVVTKATAFDDCERAMCDCLSTIVIDGVPLGSDYYKVIPVSTKSIYFSTNYNFIFMFIIMS